MKNKAALWMFQVLFEVCLFGNALAWGFFGGSWVLGLAGAAVVYVSAFMVVGMVVERKAVKEQERRENREEEETL